MNKNEDLKRKEIKLNEPLLSSPLVWASLVPLGVFSPLPWVVLGSEREVQPFYGFSSVVSLEPSADPLFLLSQPPCETCNL